MKKVCLLALLLTLTSVVQARAQDTTGLREVTLYSQNKYGFNVEKALFNFETASFVPCCKRWDLVYGGLYAGEDHDWFQVSTNREARSAFRDLGQFGWNDYFEVPVVEPFPKLKKGEERVITVDTSGADGADGKPGAQGAPGGGMEPIVLHPQQSMTQTPPPVEQPWLTRTTPPAPAPTAPRVKRDGVPKIDPVFVKAVVGHMYVIHVVEGDADFYALFHVESLVRGDRCTITWKLIPPPAASARNQEK